MCSRQLTEGLEAKTIFAARARAATRRIILGELWGSKQRGHVWVLLITFLCVTRLCDSGGTAQPMRFPVHETFIGYPMRVHLFWGDPYGWFIPNFVIKVPHVYLQA